jgi:hypothetical protein
VVTELDLTARQGVTVATIQGLLGKVNAMVPLGESAINAHLCATPRANFPSVVRADCRLSDAETCRPSVLTVTLRSFDPSSRP